MSDRAKTDLTTASVLPDFRRPPVVETSLGFYFSPLPGWNVVHVGALWEEFRGKYPRPEYLPPINLPADPRALIGQIVADVGKIPFRTCFVDDSNSQLVQVQNGCFFHNWRKTPETPQYQHFDAVRPFFKNDWEIFCSFLAKHYLQLPDVSRCEVTYFNHLVRGEDWHDISEFSSMFPAFRVSEAHGMLSKIDTANLVVSYEVDGGRLQVSVSPGVRQIDGKEVIALTVTGSSAAKGSIEELFQCLDVCHRNAVMGFVSMTGERLQTRWERVR
jgi:uncharacterized protein (TIGR04255 family)